MAEPASAADRAGKRVSFAEACSGFRVETGEDDRVTMVDARTMSVLRVCVAIYGETKMGPSIPIHYHGAHDRAASVRSISGRGGGGIICSDVTRNRIDRPRIRTTRPDREMWHAPPG